MVDTDMIRTCDPADEAPPLVVPRDAAADHPGHGRILPLVGGSRPYVYDVTFDSGRQRVYADTPAGVLAALIEGYSALWDQYKAAESVMEDLALRGESGTPDQRLAIEDAYYRRLEARIQYANTVRVELQEQENHRAQETGAWDQLSDEERTQCAEAAEGKAPLGVLVEMPWDADEGEPSTIEAGVWETDLCRLVINRGDYELFDLDGTPEPMSTIATASPSGEPDSDIVVATPWPENMIVLDPTEDWELLESMERAGVITIEVRAVDLPDQFYTEAVALGAQIRQGEVAAIQPSTDQIGDDSDD